jgi:DNA-directed RNA polymerase specialized sigma24 family protein
MDQVQDLAEGTVAKMLGVPKSDVSSAIARKTGVVGIDPGALAVLLQLIMEFIISVVQQCQQLKPQLVATVKSPGHGQKAWFRAYVIANWQDRCKWGWRQEARAAADVLMAEAADQPEAVLGAIVDEVRSVPA